MKYLAILAMFFFVIVSCDKDDNTDDNNTPNNSPIKFEWVLANPFGDDDYREDMAIKNHVTENILLDDWYILDAQNTKWTFDVVSVIYPNQILVVESDLTAKLNNTADTLYLYNGTKLMDIMAQS